MHVDLLIKELPKRPKQQSWQYAISKQVVAAQPIHQEAGNQDA